MKMGSSLPEVYADKMAIRARYEIICCTPERGV